MKMKSKMCILQKETEETYHFKYIAHSALLRIGEVHQPNANYLAKTKILLLVLSGKQKTKQNKTNKRNHQSTNQNQPKNPNNEKSLKLKTFIRKTLCASRDVYKPEMHFQWAKKDFFLFWWHKTVPLPLT